MAEKYSIKRASGWTAAGLGVSGLSGVFFAAAHQAQNHFQTLQEAFVHVAAQPEFIIPSLVLSAGFGAYMEYKRWYHANLDQEAATKARPDRNRTANNAKPPEKTL